MKTFRATKYGFMVSLAGTGASHKEEDYQGCFEMPHCTRNESLHKKVYTLSNALQEQKSSKNRTTRSQNFRFSFDHRKVRSQNTPQPQPTHFKIKIKPMWGVCELLMTCLMFSFNSKMKYIRSLEAFTEVRLVKLSIPIFIVLRSQLGLSFLVLQKEDFSTDQSPISLRIYLHQSHQ